MRRILITAGPTHEPIDAVRFIGNRSSGRLGVALATAAAWRGYRTTLLLGPSGLRPPEHSHLRTRRFRTTGELRDLLHEAWPAHDVLIMAAAVADYRPAAEPSNGKLRRNDSALELHLEPTPDLLAELATLTRADQLAIGFALEPAERLEESARAKLAAKGLAAIVANPLETMEATSITARVFLRDGSTLAPPPNLDKAAFGAWLLDQLPAIEAARDGVANR